ncbi:hypothetical protein J2S11_000776 [Bacillus horti]|uniref:Uncharacterized protein n=1 Tax=Caldalkalibacillus horti TaxID=77523 RepID=A0ABT9VV77_9BACI|nr:hypothetical protein [Bacillus horti]
MGEWWSVLVDEPTLRRNAHDEEEVHTLGFALLWGSGAIFSIPHRK